MAKGSDLNHVKETESNIVTFPEERTYKKPWNLNLNLRSLPQKTPSILRLIDSYYQNHDIIICTGAAGTAKTTTALYLLLKSLLEKNQNKYKQILIFRSSVAVENIGFLKGDEKQKTTPYDIYREKVNYLFEFNQHGKENPYDVLVNNGSLEFKSVTFEQGKTYENALILVDEFENLTFEQLDLMTTRIGKNSRIIFAGDLDQSYLESKYSGGVSEFLAIINKLISDKESVDIIDFKIEDCLRNGIIKKYLLAKYQLIKDGIIKRKKRKEFEKEEPKELVIPEKSETDLISS